MRYKYLTLIVGLFTATLVITNLLNTKLFMLFGFAFPAGILTFPLAFLVADILTEVYGYSATRRVIWTGFASLILMAVATLVADSLTPAPFWPHQEAFSALLRQVPRIVAASMLAYWAGEFTNSYVLARSKARTARNTGTPRTGMPLRFVTSTMAGQAVDTLVFMTIAFLGVYPRDAMLTLFLSSWAFKVIWEVIALPVSVPLVSWIKKAENEDHVDTNTNFSPFALS